MVRIWFFQDILSLVVFSPGLGECCGLPFWHLEVCQSRPGILRWHGHFLHPDDNLLPPQSELSQDSTCPFYQEGKQSFSVLQKDKTTALGHLPLGLFGHRLCGHHVALEGLGSKASPWTCMLLCQPHCTLHALVVCLYKTFCFSSCCWIFHPLESF